MYRLFQPGQTHLISINENTLERGGVLASLQTLF